MKVRHCVFCERKNFEERIITETSSLYFVASLGQITNGGYTLIIPKKHILCVGMASEGEVLEIEDMAVVASRVKSFN
jgi:diadenosine tetraphosphate (Ap4A) HIT family hydrolase